MFFCQIIVYFILTQSLYSFNQNVLIDEPKKQNHTRKHQIMQSGNGLIIYDKKESGAELVKKKTKFKF